MSKTSKDSVGGHDTLYHGLPWGQSGYATSMTGRRFAKKFRRREARREHRRITAEAVALYEEDIECARVQLAVLDAETELQMVSYEFEHYVEEPLEDLVYEPYPWPDFDLQADFDRADGRF